MPSPIQTTVSGCWNRKTLMESSYPTPLNWHAPIVFDALAAGQTCLLWESNGTHLDECKAIYDTYNQSEKVLYFLYATNV